MRAPTAIYYAPRGRLPVPGPRARLLLWVQLSNAPSPTNFLCCSRPRSTAGTIRAPASLGFFLPPATYYAMRAPTATYCVPRGCYAMRAAFSIY